MMRSTNLLTYLFTYLTVCVYFCVVTAAHRFLADIEFFPDSVGGDGEQLLCLGIIKHWLKLCRHVIVLSCC